ncbi:MAG: ABC transporter ATP-binding protein [Lactobacillus paracasei subsp. paracasei]|nr:ABC transporter ATP-binding protein [Lacticaseibacillus paracasei subsp. paracasei]
MQTILRITSIRYRWLLGLLTLRVLIDGFNVLISMLIQLGLTVALSGQVNLLVAIFAGMLAAAVVYTGIYFLSGVVTERLKRRVSGDIATALMANFLQDDATQVPDNGTATNLIVTDTQHIMQFLDAGVLPLVDFGITVFLGVIYVVTQSWHLALMFVAFGGLFAGVSRGLFRQQNQAQTTFIQIDDKHKAFFNDFLANVAVVRNLNVFAYNRQRHADYFQQAAPSMKQMATASGALAGIFNGGVYLAEVLTLMVGFAMLTVTGSSVAGLLGAWNAGVGSILWPFLGLAPTIGFLAQQRTSIDRVLPRLTQQVIPVFSPMKGDYQPDTIKIRGTKVSFHYPQTNREILQHLDFQIHNQGITFLIGANGAGKTTLLKLILNELQPTTGKIEIQGVPAKIKSASLFAFVPQRSVMFTASVTANLLLASQADPTKLPALLQQLQLDRYAADLDQTLQPNQLSPGEQRRLGIIRGIAADRPFIVLDEPLSDIDAVNQQAVMQLLRQEAKKRGVVIITHTFDFVTAADQVLKVGDRHDN